MLSYRYHLTQHKRLCAGAPTTTILSAFQAAANASGFQLTSMLGTTAGTSGPGKVTAFDPVAVSRLIGVLASVNVPGANLATGMH